MTRSQVRVPWRGVLATVLASAVGCLEEGTANLPYDVGPDSVVSLTLEQRAAGEPDHVPGRLLLKFRPGLEDGGRAVLQQHGAEEIGAIPQLGVRCLQVPEQALGRVEEAMRNHPDVEFVERDRILEPCGTLPRDLDFWRQQALKTIRAPQAWTITQGSPTVPIAILDTGFTRDHEDLQAKMLPGYDFWNGDSDPYHTETISNDHGSIVAGTAAAATDNGRGGAGVAWKNPIIPVKVADPFATTYTVAQGIVFAADRGARAANVSFGFYGAETLTTAAKYLYDRGGWVVVAAGNSGTRVADKDNRYVISVSGLSEGIARATASSYGPYIDFAAPIFVERAPVSGWGYFSSALDYTRASASYMGAGGTSFSAPLVSGAIGLICSADPTLTAAQVYDVLKASAFDLGASGRDEEFGWGRLDIAAAVALAAGVPAPPLDITAPTVALRSPAGGSTVGGTVEVAAEGSDDQAIALMELRLDGLTTSESSGRVVGTASTAPCRFLWDSTMAKNGRHRLTVLAYDASGNWRESSIYVTVYNATGGDATPPICRIASPADGGVVSGRDVFLGIEASDDREVTRVELWRNDTLLLCKDVDRPYGFLWNSLLVADGPHRLTARAYDSFGNVGSHAIQLNVLNAADTSAPAVALGTASGSVLSGVVSLSASASDDRGVARVEFLVDGSRVGTATSAPYSILWNTAGQAGGSHQLQAKAYDAAGNVGTSATVSVTVSNSAADTTGPAIAFVSPADGAIVSGKVTVSVSASDPSGVARLELYIDGALKSTASGSTLNFAWNSRSQKGRTVTITAAGTDTRGHVASRSIRADVR